MKTSVLTVALLGALTLPAGASAAPAAGSVRAVVLSAHGHNLRVVGAANTVRAYRVTGALPKRLRRGDKISMRARRNQASALRRIGHQRSVRFYGTVVARRQGRATLRLADGSRFALAAPKRRAARRARAAAAGPVNVTVSGLEPGQVVLVTITDGPGGATNIAIKLVEDGAGKATDDTGDGPTPGTVVSVSPEGLVLVTDKGRITIAVQDPSQLEGLNAGDQVEVFYSVDDDGTLMLDEVALPGDEPPTDTGFAEDEDILDDAA
jgi:hypothetical protein